MDEFTDVSEPEKAFMKLWNDFLLHFAKAYSDYYVAPRCIEFTTYSIQKLVELELRPQLLFHMFSLWDIGLVSSRDDQHCSHNQQKLSVLVLILAFSCFLGLCLSRLADPHFTNIR